MVVATGLDLVVRNRIGSRDGPILVADVISDGAGMRRLDLLLTGMLSIFVVVAPAQTDCTFDLGNDTSICQGQQLVLTAPAGLTDLVWSTGSTDGSITVASAGTYWLTAGSGAAGAELVVNGDFSAGATGFNSTYTLSTIMGQYGLLSDQGQYVVMTDPQVAHIDFVSCGDHTTGTGNMMVVNGAEVPGVEVWCQTVTVQPNTTYSFSAWLMTAFPSSPAVLDFAINGVAIGSPLAANATPCIWEPFAAQWNSGSATTAEICIVNQNTSIFGNDFALDDISFTTICTYTDTIEVSFGQGLDVDLGPDLAICDDDSVILDPGYPDAQVQWQDGSTTPTLTVSAGGTYSVTVTQDGCTGSDEVAIVYGTTPVLNIIGDTVLCDGTGTVLTAETSATTIAWEDGTTAFEFIATTPGIYSVTAEQNGCMATDSVVVMPGDPPWIDVSGDITLCDSQAVELTASANDASAIMWPDGTTGNTFTAASPGIYHASIANACGFAMDSAVVQLAAFHPPADMAICPGGVAFITFEGIADEVLWENGSHDLEIQLPEGTYAYQLTDSAGCLRSDTIEVFVDPAADDLVFVPNAFSPNGDGINDLFSMAGAEREEYRLQIFDRWGELIHQSEDPSASWDGTVNGEVVPVGVYVYLLNYRDTCGSTGRQRRSGHVMVVR